MRRRFMLQNKHYENGFLTYTWTNETVESEIRKKILMRFGRDKSENDMLMESCGLKMRLSDWMN